MTPIPFTFGIITDGSPEALSRLQRIITSIDSENIPQTQIIIVGNAAISHPRATVISFDESQKPRWITRKKNLVTRHAQFENVVYLHDYLALEPGWYAGWNHFGENFAACMNPILNADGTRFRDWSLFYDASSQPARDFAGAHKFANLLPYSETSLSKLMYFSGAYFVAKRSLMQEFPLDERLSWGEGEDVVWSHRVRARHNFSINPHSQVRIFGKKKDVIFTELPNDALAKMKAYITAHPPEPGYGCSDDMEHWRAHEHFGPVKKPRPLAEVPV